MREWIEERGRWDGAEGEHAGGRSIDERSAVEDATAQSGQCEAGEGPHDEERGESDDDVERHLDRECDERDDVDRDDHDPETAWCEALINSRSCWSRAPDELLSPKPPPIPEPTNEIVRCSHRMLSLSLQCLKVV